MITHDEEMAERTPRVIRLKDGEVSFDTMGEDGKAPPARKTEAAK